MLLGEIQGLDFPRREVVLYFQGASKLPPPPGGSPQLEGKELEDALASVRSTLNKLMQVDEDGDLLMPAAFAGDLQGLQLTQAMMNDLWRWRRKGGGMDSETMPHQAALVEIQEVAPVDVDRVSSILLDNLPGLSEEDKREMGGAVEGIAMNAVNGAVWGSAVAGLLFLVLFNFARGS